MSGPCPSSPPSLLDIEKKYFCRKIKEERRLEKEFKSIYYDPRETHALCFYVHNTI